MSTIIVYLLAALVVAVVIAVLGVIGYRVWRKYIKGDKTLSNTGGTHQILTVKTLDALTARWLLVAQTANAGEVELAAAAKVPSGVAIDEAKVNDLVAVELLGLANRTLRMVTAAAVNTGDQVVATASGKVITLPATAGTYYIVGRALSTSTGADDTVEVHHHAPIKVTVA